MILLTEVAEVEEFHRLRMLFENNGILLHLGNQESARNFGVFHPVGKYAVHVMLKEQLDDAQKLLLDETHIVKNKVDLEEYEQYFEKNKAIVNWQILAGLLATCAVLISLLIVFFY